MFKTFVSKPQHIRINSHIKQGFLYSLFLCFGGRSLFSLCFFSYSNCQEFLTSALILEFWWIYKAMSMLWTLQIKLLKFKLCWKIQLLEYKNYKTEDTETEATVMLEFNFLLSWNSQTYSQYLWMCGGKGGSQKEPQKIILEEIMRLTCCPRKSLQVIWIHIRKGSSMSNPN